MKTLSAAALGAGLLLSLAGPALPQQAKPAPQPPPAEKARGDAHEHDERHQQRAEKHEREHVESRDKEGRHDRD